MRFRFSLYVLTTLFFLSSAPLLVSQIPYPSAQKKQQGKNECDLDIHAGYFAPKGTDAGMLFGAALSAPFDNAIDFGFGLDVFQKSYAKEEEVDNPDWDAGQPDRRITTQIDYQSTAIPLYLSMQINIPNNQMKLGYFVRASLSYQFIITEMNNYELQVSEKQNFKGWGWQGGVGMYYRVGDRSTLVLESIYNNAVTNSRVKNEKDGLPQKDRIDLSGVGVRVGVELDLK